MNLVRLVIAGWLLLGLAACRGTGTRAADPIPGPPDDLPRVASNDGLYTIVYRAPDPIPLNEPFDLSVWVLDAKTGGPASDTALEVDARMPHHRHGMVQVPELTSLGDGRFLVSGMMCHMTGYWELYFDVTRDGVTERAQFSIELE